jgi:hypothetical protein
MRPALPLPRSHPQVGLLAMKRANGDWRREVDRCNAGRSYAQALAELPPAGDEFYANQYEAIIAAWPQREAFLQQRGTPGQLQAETLLIARLQQLLP